MTALAEAAHRERLAAGERLFARPWRFVKGVAGLDGLPEADRPEIAFAGRSNVGKSSLFNALVRQHGLARTSNTPGRTQEMNYFETEGRPLYLVDLPGYGFAKAPPDKVAAWTRLVSGYLAGRVTLKRAFLLIDARHGILAADRETMRLLDAAAVSYQAVLTKADKIGPRALDAVAAATAEGLRRHPAAFPSILVTSSETGLGVPELRALVAEIAS